MWPTPDKTEELLDLARQGNDEAVNSLMDRHRNALRHLVRMRLDRKIQRRVDVSDVVQDGKPTEWRRGRLEVEIGPGENDLGTVKLGPSAFAD